jgi:hypothetical protein
MVAKQLMERESVLSLAAIQTLFNKFFRDGRRLFGDVLDAWIQHPDAQRRLFMIDARQYATLSDADKHAARRRAREELQSRFAAIFQRRHDCIHNCDRPRQAPQPLRSDNIVPRVLDDVEFLVRPCDEHIDAEFREFLAGCGCPAPIIRQAGY